MKIEIRELHIHVDPAYVNDMKMLKRLELLIGMVNMKISELAAKLSNQTEKVEKIITEIQALKDSLSDVELPQEAIDAMGRLDAALQAADELNPDAPVAEQPV